MKDTTMKITVLCNKAGDIESVAVINRLHGGAFHVEVEGGGPVHEVEVAASESAALLGHNGPDAQNAAHEKLRGLI